MYSLFAYAYVVITSLSLTMSCFCCFIRRVLLRTGDRINPHLCFLCWLGDALIGVKMICVDWTSFFRSIPLEEKDPSRLHFTISLHVAPPSLSFRTDWSSQGRLDMTQTSTIVLLHEIEHGFGYWTTEEGGAHELRLVLCFTLLGNREIDPVHCFFFRNNVFHVGTHVLYSISLHNRTSDKSRTSWGSFKNLQPWSYTAMTESAVPTFYISGRATIRSFSAFAYNFQNSAFTHRYFKSPLNKFKHMPRASEYFSCCIISRIDRIASSYCSFLRISRCYYGSTMQQSYWQYPLQLLYFDLVLPPL